MPNELASAPRIPEVLPHCPFYGHAVGGFLWLTDSDQAALLTLIDSRGNQCALVLDAYSPCYMEIEGVMPDWKECLRIRTARAQAQLIEEYINGR